MAFIDVHGERIYYTCSHPDSNRNLVLIHGSGGDHSHWPAALRETQEVGVYALDLPGHGQSKGRGRDRVDDYAEVIAHFVAELGLSNVFLVGHSLGGAIVQTLGLRAPGWLAGWFTFQAKPIPVPGGPWPRPVRVWPPGFHTRGPSGRSSG